MLELQKKVRQTDIIGLADFTIYFQQSLASTVSHLYFTPFLMLDGIVSQD
jgi:hypothetical protein